MRIRITGDIGQDRVQRIQERYPSVEPLLEGDGRAIDTLLAWDFDAASLRETLATAPDLAWMHLRWAGVPPALLGILDGHPTVLTNGSGAHGPAVAEYVVATILSHFKHLRQLYANQVRREWDRAFRLSELGGRTVGVIGFGDLGGSTARLLRPFGVELRILRRHPEPSPEGDEIFGHADLPRFLANLDVLVVAAPLTAETRGLVDAAAIARLRRGAFLVNVGRGPIIDEGALIEALDSGHLSGAALDVFAREPLPPDSPLWALPNVTISPHCSDHTERTLDRALAIYLDNLQRFLDGGTLRNVVDRQLGY